jgi:HK97 gp10 family phage protein
MTEVIGLKDLQKQLNKIKGANKTKALEKGAYFLLGESQKHIASHLKHPEESTGFLANSGEVRVQGNDVFLIFAASYATYVELGTRFMEAMSFVGNSIEANKDEILRIVADEVESTIKKAAK